MSRAAPAVDTVLTPRPPEILWHYTSLSVFTNILEAGEFWASSLFHMNDPSELDYAQQVFMAVLDDELWSSPADADPDAACPDASEREFRRQFMTEHGKRSVGDPKLSEYLELIRNSARSAGNLPMYAVSLSQSEDDLAQWRSYCPPAAGYALGFDAAMLLELCAVPQRILVRCEYDPAEQRSHLAHQVVAARDALKLYYGSLRRHPPPAGSLGHQEIIARQSTTLQRDFARIKHPAFHAESEWRLVETLPINGKASMAGDLGGTASHLRPDGFRRSQTMLIPFRRIRFPTGWKEEGFLRKVQVGPTIHPALAASSARIFLEEKGLGATVGESQIPYRPVF